MKKILSILRKKKVWIPSVIVLVIVLIAAFSGGNGAAGTTVAVERGSVVSDVSLTGKVKPSQSVDLGFERSGRLERVNVSVGQKVSAGTTLVELENADARSQVAQAAAQYDSQAARLQELQKGAAEANLAVSETALSNAYQAAFNALYDAHSKSEDAVRAQTSEFFLYDEERSPEISFASTETDAKILASQYRYQSGSYLDELNASLLAATYTDRQKIETLLRDTQQKIKYFLQLFGYLDTALNGANGLTSETRATYKGYILAGRTELNTALSSLSTREQAIASAKRDLELKQSGSTAEELAYQEAQLAQARANVQYAQSQLAKTIIRAPFAGTITKLPYNKGDIVQAQSVAVSIIGTGAYQIETHVTESDIAKIRVGDTAQITLDAYTDDLVFEAAVAQIDLSETVIDGVPTYKATLQLAQEDERIISGMTANVDLVSEQKGDVLYVPTRNILTRDGKKYVKKAGEKPGEFEEVEIQTGLRGSDGRTEILSGVNEGDLIAAE